MKARTATAPAEVPAGALGPRRAPVRVRAGALALLAIAFLHLAVSTVRRGKGDILGYFVIGQAVLHGESPYLVWRRRWRAAAWTLLAFVGVSLSPVLVSGWAGFVRDVHEWRLAMGVGWGSGMMNQSMPATWDRFLGHGVVPFRTPPSNVLAATGGVAVAVAVWATRLLTMGLALWTLCGPIEPDGRSALAEWSVVFLVGAVYGPITHKAYLVVLVLPYALLFALAADRRRPRGLRRGAAALLVLVLLLSVVPSRDFVGRTGAAYFQMAGSYTIPAMAILFGLFWVRRWPALDEASLHPGASLTRTGAP